MSENKKVNLQDDFDVKKELVEKYNTQLEELMTKSENYMKKRDTSTTKTRAEYYHKKLTKNNQRAFRLIMKLNQMRG